MHTRPTRHTPRAAIAAPLALAGLLAGWAPAQATPSVGGAAQWANAGNGITAPLVLRTGDFSPAGGFTGATNLNLSAGFTAMFWARPDAVIGSFGALYSLYQPGGSSWALYTTPGGLNLWQTFENSQHNPRTLFSLTAVPLQQWTLVTVVADPSAQSLRLYLGSQLDAQAAGVPLATAPGTLVYGSTQTTAAQVTMGDFGLWNHALSQTQVAALLTAQAAPPVPEASTAALLLAGLAGLLGLRTARGRPTA